MALVKRWLLSLVFSCLFIFAFFHLITVSKVPAAPPPVPPTPPLDVVDYSSGGYGTNKEEIPKVMTTPEPLSKPPTRPPPTLVEGDLWWHTRKEQYPVNSVIQLPQGEPVDIPKIQFDFKEESREARETRLARRDAIKESFKHAWRGYKSNAWLHDEVGPISGKPKDPFGGWAATLVDSLDTLWIMGLTDEFEEAVAAVKKIDFTEAEVSVLNVFETTIRYLGGLLSIHDLTGGQYPVLLDKAIELGDMLYVAFDTPNRMPVLRWDWKKAKMGKKQQASNNVVVAELGSLSLEFTRLAQLTGESKYFDAIQRVTNELHAQQHDTKLPGMWPIGVDARTPKFTTDSAFSFGAMADSLYEYLPKEYLMLGGQSAQYRKMYEDSMETAKKYLLFRPATVDADDILISGSVRASGGLKKPVLNPGGQHLTCFVGGMVGIGAKIFNRPEELSVARKLTDGCIWAYENTPTGVMPEMFECSPCDDDPTDCKWEAWRWFSAARPQDEETAQKYRADAQKTKGLVPGFSSMIDKRYLLRPEAIESVFILYRITGDTTLQDKGWNMFTAIERHCRTAIAHASLTDVASKDTTLLDTMESFWTAETLKYFYLLFSEPDLVDLDKYVFNTEAHPFKRPT